MAKSRVKERWVVKAGSNMVCSGGPLLLRAWMRQVSELNRQGIEVIWVTSGAIASAVDRTSFHAKRNRELPEKQALSAIGQPIVMDLYNLALAAQGHLGAQILLTYSDLEDPKRLLNFRSTVEKLLQWKVTPILNENDAVATEEIRFGDNDSLSAKVAKVMKARRLVILTDVDGCYDSDPRKNPKAKLISKISKLKAEHFKLAGGSGSKRGTGGMLSKLKAADEAQRAGIETWLVRADVTNVLGTIAQGKPVGTHIQARSRKRK